VETLHALVAVGNNDGLIGIGEHSGKNIQKVCASHTSGGWTQRRPPSGLGCWLRWALGVPPLQAQESCTRNLISPLFRHLPLTQFSLAQLKPQVMLDAQLKAYRNLVAIPRYRCV
jgi:hypothetical protein